MKECSGGCDTHEGLVRKVHVVDTEKDHDWGEFYYCDSAIKEDLSRGLTVTETEDND